MIFIILVSIFLMFIVLIQSSKGGGLAGTFGGSDASMMFGVRRTSDFLIKLTSVLAAIFLLFSLVTNIIINKSGGNVESIIQQNGQQFPSQQVPTDMAPQQEQQQNPQQQQPQEQNQNQQNQEQKPK
jgi:preprotein translocase subunit SecG